VRHAGRGVDVWVAALNRGGPSLEAARSLGAHAVVLGGRGAPHARIARLLRLIRDEGIDVVNGHNPSGSLYATLAARLAGVPMIRTEHSLHYPNRHSRLFGLSEPVLTWLTRRVVCVCQAVLQSHVNRLPWAARRFVSVANGISPAPHTRPRGLVRGELGIGEHEVVVLNVGSLTIQKAQAFLLRAFAEASRAAPALRLVIAGEGPLRASLEAERSSLGLEGRVDLLGPRGDVADLMEAADAYVLASVREGLSVTLLEAMRAGRPALVTDIGGNAEAVEDGVTGRVVPVGDGAALARGLTELAGDPARRAAWGAAARERWRSRFTAERMVRETEALYREALGDRTAWTAVEEARHAAS
jgi:glycosyltransferase involved in cell wall biosynthesis